MDIGLVVRTLAENGLSERVFFVPDERGAIACLLFHTRGRQAGEEAGHPAAGNTLTDVVDQVSVSAR